MLECSGQIKKLWLVLYLCFRGVLGSGRSKVRFAHWISVCSRDVGSLATYFVLHW